VCSSSAAASEAAASAAACVATKLYTLSAESSAAAVVAGFSRLLLDSFANDPLLFATEQGPAHAAAVMLSSDQWTQMVESNQTQDVNASPGTLQMLQVGENSKWQYVLPSSSAAEV
jgi:hypothetical protein